VRDPDRATDQGGGKRLAQATAPFQTHDRLPEEPVVGGGRDRRERAAESAEQERQPEDGAEPEVQLVEPAGDACARLPADELVVGKPDGRPHEHPAHRPALEVAEPEYPSEEPEGVDSYDDQGDAAGEVEVTAPQLGARFRLAGRLHRAPRDERGDEPGRDADDAEGERGREFRVALGDHGVAPDGVDRAADEE